MKKIALLFSLMLCVLCLSAQNRQGSNRNRMTVEERAKQTTEWMKEALDLTSEQVAPVDSINLLYVKAQQVLFQSSEGDRSKIREALVELEAKKVESLKTVLTAEQLETYKKKSEEMRTRGRNRSGQGSRRQQ